MKHRDQAESLDFVAYLAAELTQLRSLLSCVIHSFKKADLI
jgi:hypothetical protein